MLRSRAGVHFSLLRSHLLCALLSVSLSLSLAPRSLFSTAWAHKLPISADEGSHLTTGMTTDVNSSGGPSGRMPSVFVSHGGGPSFFLSSPGRMADIGPNSAAFHSLRRLPAQLGLTGDRKPAAIVVVSGHWESSDGVVHITSRDDYGGRLLYDYGGFPPETYHLQYRAPGSSALAARIHGLLQDSGIASVLDSERLWDHGVFVPLKVMFPAADIPVVQLSLLSSLSAAAHLAIGRALAPLRDERVLIVASGFVTHNLSPAGDMHPFVTALASVLTQETGEKRWRQLQQWQKLPAARHAHSREEHLIPLMVAAGAAEEEPAVELFSSWVMQGGGCFANYAFGQVQDVNAQ